MKLDQLTYFLETANQQHVGKAAKTMGISPSAISHSISALEEELGRPLFVKRGKHIILNEHGKLLQQRAKRLLSDVNAMKDALASEEAEWQGHYRLAASHLVASRLLVPVWSELQKNNPALSAEIFTLRSGQVVTGVAAGEFDLGLCFSPQAHPDLIAEPILKGDLLITVRSGHPLLKLPLGKRLKELNQYPAVLPKSFQGIDVCERHPMFEKFSLEPRAAVLFDSYAVGSEHISRSDAWSLFPDWILSLYSSQVKTLGKPEGWDAPYNVSIVRSRHRYHAQVLRALSERLIPQGRS